MKLEIWRNHIFRCYFLSRNFINGIIFGIYLQGCDRSTRWTARRIEETAERVSIAGIIQTSFSWTENAMLFQTWERKYKEGKTLLK